MIGCRFLSVPASLLAPLPLLATGVTRYAAPFLRKGMFGLSSRAPLLGYERLSGTRTFTIAHFFEYVYLCGVDRRVPDAILSM